MTINSPSNELARAYRANSGRIVASLVRYCGDLQQAEDALHEACLQAEAQWSESGLPNDSAAWLFVAAKRRLLDRLRAEQRSTRDLVLQDAAMAMQGSVSEEAQQAIPDERLALIFTCCHPSLNLDAQVALTLKTLCGLSVREIARAFLLSDTALGQRLVRAKHKLRVNGIAYKVPDPKEMSQRLRAVLAVIYFIYNESYSAFEGQTLTRDDLAKEAIRLARLLVHLLPQPEAQGLLALLLLHQSRRAARQDKAGRMISLEHQDRRVWNQSLAREGRAVLTNALEKGKAGQYQMQAAISAVHASASTWAETDWGQIIGLYRQLLKVHPNAIARLNMYSAVAHSGELNLARNGVKKLQSELENYQPYYAALADIEFKLGNLNSARVLYEQAIELCKNHAEKEFLNRQLDAIPRSV